jgi:hypothetical protein
VHRAPQIGRALRQRDRIGRQDRHLQNIHQAIATSAGQLPLQKPGDCFSCLALKLWGARPFHEYLAIWSTQLFLSSSHNHHTRGLLVENEKMSDA